MRYLKKLKLPNKIISYQESVLPKIPVILTKLREKGTSSPVDMYNANKKHFLNIADYIETLDCCFVLGMVRLNENGELIYVS